MYEILIFLGVITIYMLIWLAAFLLIASLPRDEIEEANRKLDEAAAEENPVDY